MSRKIIQGVVAVIVLLGFAGISRAEDPVYSDGPVVSMTYVKVKPGGFEQYMKFLSTDWKPLNEALKKDGVVTAYRVVGSESVNRDDWDLMLVVEYKNMAALDSIEEKSRALTEKMAGSMAKAEEQTSARGEIREILGSKLGRELILK